MKNEGKILDTSSTPAAGRSVVFCFPCDSIRGLMGSQGWIGSEEPVFQMNRIVYFEYFRYSHNYEDSTF